jgi:hypothetical protein
VSLKKGKTILGKTIKKASLGITRTRWNQKGKMINNFAFNHFLRILELQ